MARLKRRVSHAQSNNVLLRRVCIWGGLIAWLLSASPVHAAIAVIAVINLDRATLPTEYAPTRTVSHIVVPRIDFEVEATALTDPLAQELENLREDLRKVEETVRNDIRFDF